MIVKRFVRHFGSVGLAVLCLSGILAGQQGTKNGEWRSYGGDVGSTRYAPLDQINATNFKDLQVKWTFRTDMLGRRIDYNMEATPLMANGVLYTTAGSRRNAVAIDPVTGELLWMYRIDEGRRGQSAPRQGAGRGLAYWTDGKSDERILYVTPGYQLVCLDAKTGRPVAEFGKEGIVDLKQNNDQEIDLDTGEVGLNSAPVVARNVVIVGAAHRASASPKSKTNVKGYIRGFDVKTGKRLWAFHTIPRPGEFGNDTWEKDSWAYTGNTGMWAPFSVDEELGMAYLPIELATGDFYGGHRPGNNLFSESLVAVELETGKRIWHFQTIHHGIWDYDIPCAGVLGDVTVDGKPIKVIAQPVKQGFVFVLDRQTGKPVWPIEERPVPKGNVPGEWYAPTQPFPTKPPVFDRTAILESDVIDFTPELKAEGLKLLSKYQLGPLYTPPPLLEAGTKPLVYMPFGANWTGASFDPETGILYVPSITQTKVIGVHKADPAKTDMAYVQENPGGEEGEEGGMTVQGLPIFKPPYARITAIDLNKGDIVWQIAHGETPDVFKNHPALKGLTIPRTGRAGRGISALTTKTLLIAGESGFFTTPSGQRGAMLRAYDKATGKEVGAVYMPAGETGAMMSYMANGKQYIVIAVGGAGVPAQLVAYGL